MFKRFVIFAIALVCVLFVVANLSAQEFGTNWTGIFYNNNSLSDPAVSTINGINGLNFNWASGPPVVNGVTVTGINNDRFSARFSSTQNFQQGSYRFTVTFDDKVRVRVDGQQVFEEFNDLPEFPKTRTFDVALAAGAHNIAVEYVEETGQAVLQLQWALGGAAATAGPSPTVGPSPTPGPTSTPAPTGLPAIGAGTLSATVIRAVVLNVRSAPYLGAERVGRIMRGQTYAVVGRDPDARWFLLQLSDRQAWAWGYYLAVNGNEFNAPVVSSFVTQGNPAAQTGVVAQTRAVMKLRAEPNVYSAQIGRIPWGDILPVIGKSYDGVWWQVVFRGTTGWVFSEFAKVLEGDLDSVPIIP